MSQDHLTTLRCKETGETKTIRFNRKRLASYSNKNFKLKLKKFSPKLNKVVTWFVTKKAFSKK